MGSSEHFLLNEKNQARKKQPVCKEAGALASFVLTASKHYPPYIVIDLHEDESKRDTYIYVNSELKEKDPVAEKVIKILRKNHVSLQKTKKTRFNEEIIDGMAINVQDGSIDELLAAKKIVIKNNIRKGPSCPHVVVVETIALDIPLHKRIATHKQIIDSLEDMWNEISKT